MLFVIQLFTWAGINCDEIYFIILHPCILRWKVVSLLCTIINSMGELGWACKCLQILSVRRPEGWGKHACWQLSRWPAWMDHVTAFQQMSVFTGDHGPCLWPAQTTSSWAASDKHTSNAWDLLSRNLMKYRHFQVLDLGTFRNLSHCWWPVAC